jgi:hypothetical protein
MEEIYYQRVARWGHIVIQTGLRSGIPKDEWQQLSPEGGHRVLPGLRAPIEAAEYGIPVNTWENRIWVEIRKKILKQVSELMKMEIHPK